MTQCTNSSVIEIKVRSKHLESAQKRWAKIPTNSKTISKSGKKYGILAEEIFIDSYGGILIDNKEYDIDYKSLGKIDIKTKRCWSCPDPSYNCTVAKYQLDRGGCDFYAFYRIRSDYSTAWFLGMISAAEFKKTATFMKSGTRAGNFICKADCYNIPISSLKTINELKTK